MSAAGSMPAAAACIAWARPISAPSRVTNEFSDMFCALNGATFTSCRASHRHNPATSTLLPASEPVPATSSVPRTDAGYWACMFGLVHGGTCMANQAKKEAREMLLLILALLVILALFGAGFALHLLWWVAIIALVLFLVGFFMRRR